MAQKRTYRPQEDGGKQPIVMIAVLLVLIFVVGGALLYMITQKGGGPGPQQNVTPPAPPQNATNNTNQTNQTAPCGDPCLLEQALSAGNHALCGRINSTSMQQECYQNLSAGSLDACMMVSDAQKKRACATAFAVSLGNLSICDALADGADACKAAVDPCYASSSEPLCRALLAENPALCGSNQECLINYSLEMRDPAPCYSISSQVVSKACISSVLVSDRCSELALQAQKDYCYQLFALYSGDYLTCTQISSGSIYALDCYSTFAGILHNSSICVADHLGLNERWQCYTNYSLLTEDKSGCGLIDALATTNRFRCAFEYAKKFGDPSSCEFIGDVASRSTCYEGVMIYSNDNLDWRHCADVSSFNWRNKCYTESAKLNDDVGLCDYIAEDFAAESCRSSYEAYKNGG